MVNALVNEKVVALRVATGTSLSSVTKGAVRELMLATGPSRLRLTDSSGQSENTEARLPSLTLGDLKLGETTFMVLPGEDTPGTGTEVFGGILGSEMLPIVDFDFDFAGNKLNLFAVDHCFGNVVYWRAPNVGIVPFAFNEAGQITFRMELDGRRLDAMLDTGASATFLNLDIARRTFRVDLNAPDVEQVGEVTGGYSANVYRRRFKTVSLGGVTVSDPVITMFPDMMTGMTSNAPRTGSLIRDDRRALPDIVVGMNTLSQLHVYIAARERKLYVTPARAPATTAQ